MMSLIRQLPGIIDKAKEQYMLRESFISRQSWQIEFESTGKRDKQAGKFLLGDNIAILCKGLASGELYEQFDMIYCDPPFFTKGDRGVRIPVKSETVPEADAVRLKAYHDRWDGGINGYLSELALCLMLMRDALKDTGSIFIHLDWHVSHAVKLIMDEIFGEKQFINEIIWTYKSGGAARRHLSRKHDTILFYSKSGQYKFHNRKEKSYNRGGKPYRFKGIAEYEDENGWYTLVNQKDVWQINMVGRSASERLNYATQKPEALIKRLIELVTDEGDLCGDFYCGSGTLASAAEKAGRRFVCADVSPLALVNAMKRPLKDGYGFFVENCTGQSRSGCEIKARKDGKNVILESFSGSQPEMVIKKDRETIHSILEKDPFALIDYWCVGTTAEDGSFHEVKTVFRSGGGQVEREIKEVQESVDSIWVTDIFGQTAHSYL